MRRIAITMFLLSGVVGCHAHTTAQDKAQLESPPDTKQVSSARPVRTTPGGMLDPVAMHKLQHALASHGEKVQQTGLLDEQTQAAIRAFQKHQSQPATGLPDYDTLKRLGLDAQDIYLGGTKRRDAAAKR